MSGLSWQLGVGMRNLKKENNKIMDNSKLNTQSFSFSRSVNL